MGTEVRGQLPDMGLVNCRYTLILDGKTGAERQAAGPDRLLGGPAAGERGGRLRLAAGHLVPVKFTVEPKEQDRDGPGKVWKKGEAEPAKWTIEYEDPNPNTEGAAALYGYISDPSISAKEPGLGRLLRQRDDHAERQEVTPRPDARRRPDRTTGVTRPSLAPDCGRPDPSIHPISDALHARRPTRARRWRGRDPAVAAWSPCVSAASRAERRPAEPRRQAPAERPHHVRRHPRPEHGQPDRQVRPGRLPSRRGGQAHAGRGHEHQVEGRPRLAAPTAGRSSPAARCSSAPTTSGRATPATPARTPTARSSRSTRAS